MGEPPPDGTISRRLFLGGAAAIGVGAAAAGLTTWSDAATEPASGTVSASSLAVTFTGAHQAGIVTPAQDRLVCAAFDVTSSSRAELVDLLRTWTTAAGAMAAGRPVTGDDSVLAPPADTGEALGLPPSRLTVTAGFGPDLFDDRFGLGSRRPAVLKALPPLPGDELEPARCGGDIGIQACSDDPQVAFHAVRNLARLARGVAVLRWLQLGFGRTSSTSEGQQTPRNLMGFKDGTRNIRSQDHSELERSVWVGPETDQPWMRGGSYVVIRRIRMTIEVWDRTSLQEQEAVIGRYKSSGAPLSGHREFDAPNFAATTKAGGPVIPADAHVRLASPETNGGLRLLRRGYSYTDGIDPRTGELDAGLFFIAYQRDPIAQFVALQRKLGVHDSLTEYIKHTGSAVFACPPGLSGRGDHWGQALFA